MSRNVMVGTVCDGVENPEIFFSVLHVQTLLSVVCMEHTDFVQGQRTPVLWPKPCKPVLAKSYKSHFLSSRGRTVPTYISY